MRPGVPTVGFGGSPRHEAGGSPGTREQAESGAIVRWHCLCYCKRGAVRARGGGTTATWSLRAGRTSLPCPSSLLPLCVGQHPALVRPRAGGTGPAEIKPNRDVVLLLSASAGVKGGHRYWDSWTLAAQHQLCLPGRGDCAGQRGAGCSRIIVGKSCSSTRREEIWVIDMRLKDSHLDVKESCTWSSHSAPITSSRW